MIGPGRSRPYRTALLLAGAGAAVLAAAPATAQGDPFTLRQLAPGTPGGPAAQAPDRPTRRTADDIASAEAGFEQRTDTGIEDVETALRVMDDTLPRERDPSRAARATNRGTISVLSRERPEYAPTGVQAGPFTLFPSTGARILADSNIYQASSNPVADLALVPSARVTGRTNWARHDITFDVQAESPFYLDTPRENLFVYEATVGGRYDLTGRDWLRGSVEHARRKAQRRAIGELPNTLEPVRFTDDRARLQGHFERGPFGMTIRSDVRRQDFSDSVDFSERPIDQDFRDLTTASGTVAFEYYRAPDASIFGSIGIERRDFRIRVPQFDRDATGYDVQFGVQGYLSPLVRGRVALGVNHQDFVDRAVGDFTFLTFDADLLWLASELTNVTLTANRYVGNPAIITSPAFIGTRIGVRVDHELLRNVLVLAELSYQTADFIQSPRNDEFLRLNTGIDWTLSPRLVLSLTSSLSTRDADNVPDQRDRDFNEATVSVGFTVRW